MAVKGQHGGRGSAEVCTELRAVGDVNISPFLPLSLSSCPIPSRIPPKQQRRKSKQGYSQHSGGQYEMMRQQHAYTEQMHQNMPPSPFHPLSSTNTITVQGLAPQITLREIREQFSKYGRTLRVWSVDATDIGMVTYSNPAEAEAAIRGEYASAVQAGGAKVSPSDYSAAPVSSVQQGDSKYWRCSLCHNTNRATSEECSAYRCGYSKEESEKEWGVGLPPTLSGKPHKDIWELARLSRALAPEKAPEHAGLEPPHCLIVLNLLPTVTEQQVRRVFTNYGSLSFVRLLPPVLKIENAVEAQVVFDDSFALERAVEHENGKQISVDQRVRAHRATSSFVIAVRQSTPFVFASEEEVQAMKTALFTVFSEFGVVQRVTHAEDEMRVAVPSLRSALKAVFHHPSLLLQHPAMLLARNSFDRSITFHLSNSRETKWPCLSCCIINPPKTEACLDCETPRPNYAAPALRTPKLWEDSMRKKAGATAAAGGAGDANKPPQHQPMPATATGGVPSGKGAQQASKGAKGGRGGVGGKKGAAAPPTAGPQEVMLPQAMMGHDEAVVVPVKDEQLQPASGSVVDMLKAASSQPAVAVAAAAAAAAPRNGDEQLGGGYAPNNGGKGGKGFYHTRSAGAGGSPPTQ